MNFNVKKCAVLSITRKRSPKVYKYTLLGEDLTRVDKHDYLGVTISHDLRWNDHCNKIINKASRTLGLLHRTMSPCSQEVKSQAYSTLVRPQLEYASEVWNPSTITEINRIEQIQKAAARFAFADYRKTTHVTPLIEQLDWDQLHTRRLIQQATMLYRIHYNLVNISPPPCFQRAPHISARLNHPLKYVSTNAPTVNVYKYAFYPRTVAIWNRLPHEAVLHITPSVKFFQGFAAPAIRSMALLHGNLVL